jgi:prepilin peptidase CpaA
MPNTTNEISYAVLAAILLIACITDVRSGRIPNWLVVSGAAAGLALAGVQFGWRGAGSAALGLLCGFTLYFPLYLLRARGAGDVKLLAAVGAVVGLISCVEITALSAVCGGVIALAVATRKKRLGKTFRNLSFIVHELINLRLPYTANTELDVRHPESVRIPHAIVLASGTVAFLVMGAR